jgi:16S rRNA (uracil1498-N3)-methyltransferase
MHVAYLPKIDSTTLFLDDNESNHCLRVLRMRQGDRLLLMDGKGSVFKSKILDAKGKNCLVQIMEKYIEVPQAEYKLHIALSPTKQIDRFNWFVEKATEIGVGIITPIFCDNSERTVLKTERVEKIIIAALKQSINPWRPVLSTPRKFSNFIAEAEDEQRFIAYCTDEHLPLLQEVAKNNSNTTVMIGPEGDFSSEEVEKAISKGFTPVSLGKNRYRTETAGVLALYSLVLINQKKPSS